MRILYIGQFIPNGFRNRYGEKFDSLYRSSEIIINGFRSITDKIDVITLPDIASYKQSNLFYVPNQYYKDENVKVVSFINIRFFKTIWGIISLVYSSIKIINNIPKGETVWVVIPYMVFKHVLVSRILKLLFHKKVNICQIVPDIFFPKSKVFKFFNKWTENMARKNDCFVLYTEAMAEYLSIPSSKYRVFEGYLNLKPRKINIPTKKFIITYTGSLNIEYGIGRLLDSMKIISSKDCELHLYGNGNAVSLIKERSSVDNRIKYFGLVTKEEAIKSLYNSSVLINPRNDSDGEYVKYSFPSKDIEYLSSGIPCILCKLPGMPKEYYGYFIDANDGSVDSLSMAILKVMNMNIKERIEKGLKAQEFILKRMDNKLQAKAIIELMKGN